MTKSCATCKHYRKNWLGAKYDKCVAHKGSSWDGQSAAYIELIFDYPAAYSNLSRSCKPKDLVRWEKRPTIKEDLARLDDILAEYWKKFIEFIT
jgi:hypothetical protein